MKQYLRHDAWNILEQEFHPEYNEISESCFSIGNGKIGQRGYFEEQFSGASFRGSYVAGIYFSSKTGNDFSKNGCPEQVNQMLNAPDWAGIEILVNGEVLDLATCRVKNFWRVLNMKTGCLERSFVAKIVSGKEIQVSATRFCSIVEKEAGVIRYSVKPLNFDGTITITSYIDGNVVNKGDDQADNCWVEIEKSLKKRSGYLTTMTQRSHFHLCTGMKFEVFKKGALQEMDSLQQHDEKYIACSVKVNCKAKDDIVIHKYAAVVSSLEVEKSKLTEHCKSVLKRVSKKGFDQLYRDHSDEWALRWEKADIAIEGDLAAQQGIRFHIFQLLQALSGDDERLNMAPAGFTGQKSGGWATWETEIFCLPFYLAATDENIARNLLIYRYKHLPLAIENAERLGFSKGAALFPSATLNGEECRNEWEVSLGGIHRNGAVAYAIYNYIRNTGDQEYLVDYGLEVLIGIARFWSQRVHWSAPKQQYVIHGVTGPNEYECNVCNNWYTNLLAAWCLRYTLEAMAMVEATAPEAFSELLTKLEFDRLAESSRWTEIAEKMYFPGSEPGIFLQQEGFMEKEIRTVGSLQAEDLPLGKKWSWDRLLRSCFIRQPDVLQGIFLFEDRFSDEEISRNFDFYDPMTVQESEDSCCIPALLAARLGRQDRVLQMFQRTVRYDLDSHTDATENGLHLRVMAGNWLTFTGGFCGMRVQEGMLSFRPFLPDNWEGYSVRLCWRGCRIEVNVSGDGVLLKHHHGPALQVKLFGEIYELAAGGEIRRPKDGTSTFLP